MSLSTYEWTGSIAVAWGLIRCECGVRSWLAGPGIGPGSARGIAFPLPLTTQGVASPNNRFIVDPD